MISFGGFLVVFGKCSLLFLVMRQSGTPLHFGDPVELWKTGNRDVKWPRRNWVDTFVGNMSLSRRWSVTSMLFVFGIFVSSWIMTSLKRQQIRFTKASIKDCFQVTTLSFCSERKRLQFLWNDRVESVWPKTPSIKRSTTKEYGSLHKG